MLKPGDVVQHTIKQTAGWGYPVGRTILGVVQRIHPQRVEVSFRTASHQSVKRWFVLDTWRKAA